MERQNYIERERERERERPSQKERERVTERERERENPSESELRQIMLRILVLSDNPIPAHLHKVQKGHFHSTWNVLVTFFPDKNSPTLLLF